MLWVTVLVMFGLLAGLIALTTYPVPGKLMAVAQATYRETIRQPLFWILLVFSAVFMFGAVFLPFFTLGEDLKMMKDLTLDAILVPTLIICVFITSMSIAEEIEGRTAITLLSKPVSRRQFILGKFVGVLLAGGLMMTILTFVMGACINFRIDNEGIDRPPDHPTIVATQSALESFPGVVVEALRYILLIFNEIDALAPGVFLIFCQVMILTSVAVALATRLPMVVNVVICAVVFFMGRLTHVLEVQSRDNKLVNFVAQIFSTFLPALNYYDVGPAIVGEVAVPWLGYVGPALLHAVIYTTIALLFGLILFEDRDLA